MSPSEDCSEQLFDHFVLADDDLLQLLLHDLPMLAKLLKDVAQVTLFRGHRDSLHSGSGEAWPAQSDHSLMAGRSIL